jgi:hypothetical protein
VALDQRLALVAGEWGAGLVALLAPHARDGHRPEGAEACNETRMVRKVPLERRPDRYCIRVSHACDREREPSPLRSRTNSPTPLRGGMQKESRARGTAALSVACGETTETTGEIRSNTPHPHAAFPNAGLLSVLTPICRAELGSFGRRAGKALLRPRGGLALNLRLLRACVPETRLGDADETFR